MKWVLAILLGFAVVFSQNGPVEGGESGSGLLRGDVQNQGVSVQKGNKLPGAVTSTFNGQQINHEPMHIFEGKRSVNFSPEFRGKDSVARLVSHEESDSSDSSYTAIYLTGIGFIFFVGLARRGILPLVKS